MQEVTYRDRDSGVVKQFKEMFAVAPDNIEETLKEKYAEAMAKMTGNNEFVSIKQQAIGRNDPCPCGSGRKFKKCCIKRIEGPKQLVTKE